MTASVMCIFCVRPWGGEVKHSEQHVLGQRLKKHAEGLPNARISTLASLVFDPQTHEFVAPAATGPLTRGSSLLNMRTRDVCEECNKCWMKRLEEEATPLFLALADAAKNNAQLTLSRAEARTLARRAQVLARTHELTTPGPRVGEGPMGTRLRDGLVLLGSMVWLARTQEDLGIQVRQSHIDISPTPIVMPGDAENLSLLLAISWFHLTVLTYIPEAPGRTQGPALPSTDGRPFSHAEAHPVSSTRLWCRCIPLRL